MRLLFVGGTGFVGRHMVEAALAREHDVTLFNRGKTAGPDLFPAAKRIIGDRDGGLSALDGRAWDAVIDVNGYTVRLVDDSLAYFKDKVDQYVFVSTGSVFDFANIDREYGEDVPLVESHAPDSEEYWGPEYGPLKRVCEDHVAEQFTGRFTTLRLGVVAGPFDPTDRCTYYVARAAEGGEMLVPAKPDDILRFIDARDLANFTMLAIEKRLIGVYNTLGAVITWQTWMDACLKAGGSDTTLVWIDDREWLKANLPRHARLFGALPMMASPAMSNYAMVNTKKAQTAGLTYRPAFETARDTLAWHKTRDLAQEESTADELTRIRNIFSWGRGTSEKYEWNAGLTRVQETEILGAWSERSVLRKFS
jgi:2'-hydroxyisoflavone reductase